MENILIWIWRVVVLFILMYIVDTMPDRKQKADQF